jgi:cytochrome P450
VSRDILTLLLEAQDPETGRGMTETEVRANLLTFMVAGQETTANLITWVLFLLSQSPEWRERVTQKPSASSTVRPRPWRTGSSKPVR